MRWAEGFIAVDWGTTNRRAYRLDNGVTYMRNSVKVVVDAYDGSLDSYVADADEPAALGELEMAIRQLKNELDVNVVPVGPADFLPIPRSVLERSRYIGRYGRLDVYYFDLPSQIIAKAARGLEQDFADAESLLRSGEVTWDAVEARWREIRSSPTGWLRYEPAEVDERLRLLRQRLDTNPSQSNTARS